MEEIKLRIKQHEGFRDTIYSDSLGFATIGYGHLVLPSDNFVEGTTYPKEMLEKVFDLPIVIFSPILDISSTKFSLTILPLFIFSLLS